MLNQPYRLTQWQVRADYRVETDPAGHHNLTFKGQLTGPDKLRFSKKQEIRLEMAIGTEGAPNTEIVEISWPNNEIQARHVAHSIWSTYYYQGAESSDTVDYWKLCCKMEMKRHKITWNAQRPLSVFPACHLQLKLG